MSSCFHTTISASRDTSTIEVDVFCDDDDEVFVEAFDRSNGPDKPAQSGCVILTRPEAIALGKALCDAAEAMS